MHGDRVEKLVAIFEQALTGEVRSRDSQHIFAKDFPDRLVAVPALHQADGEERPVGPGEAALGVRLGLVIVRWPEVLPARGGRTGPFRNPGTLGPVVARDVRNAIRAIGVGPSRLFQLNFRVGRIFYADDSSFITMWPGKSGRAF